MLADGSAVAFCDSSNSVTVCIVSESRNSVVFRPCVEHGHSHTIVVRCDDINLVAERRCPGADCVTSGSSIPCCTGRVLHFLRSKLTNGIFFPVYGKGSILYNSSRTIYVGSGRVTYDFAIGLNSSTECLANTSCTCDGIVMSDITDCKNVSDYAITITVDGINVFLDVISNHLTLKLSTLISIETYIIGIAVKV